MAHTDAWGYTLRPLRNGKEWEIVEDYVYINRQGSLHLTVEAGFVFDGASIPRVFWRLIGPPMAGKYAHASLIHDYLYVHQKSLITRKAADDIMLEIMQEDGVSWWKRNAIHRGVRLGGGRAWRT